MTTRRTLSVAGAVCLLLLTPGFSQTQRHTVESTTPTQVERANRNAQRQRTTSARSTTTAHHATASDSAKRKSKRKSDKQKAKIDSLDADLHHDGCFWIVEIEYEVELEGFASDDAFILGLELMRDDKPVTDDKGEPIVVVVELNEPKKDKKGEREYEGKLRIRVHKDWVQNDDDLDIQASLVRAADGRIFDTEDESADKDRPGPTLHIGVCGIGISIPL
ncbi:MAG: hypothetical protein KDA33_09145 [Phycisphaerales bacterium]|nr:hypothetical protein [Phycisphaerales bacterium]